MQSSLRKLLAIATLLVVAYQPACSSDDGDDDGGDGGGGSAGASGSGGMSGSGGGSNCNPPCASDETCTGCMNPNNPDEPLWACIPEGVAC
jgi:hypothetical protein